MILDDVLAVVNEHKISLTESDVLNLLKNRKRFPYEYSWGQPSVRIISEFRHVADFFDHHGYFIFDEWKKYYDLGFTGYICNILDLTEELRELDEKIFRLVGRHINGNLYISNGKANGKRVSYDLHNHDHPVIIKPIYGKSKWVLGDQQFENTQESFIIHTAVPHCVYQCNEPRLSMTLKFS